MPPGLVHLTKRPPLGAYQLGTAVLSPLHGFANGAGFAENLLVGCQLTSRLTFSTSTPTYLHPHSMKHQPEPVIRHHVLSMSLPFTMTSTESEVPDDPSLGAEELGTCGQWLSPLTSQYIPPTGSRQTNHSTLSTLKPTSPWRDDSCAHNAPLVTWIGSLRTMVLTAL